jgi:hypothetical protein
MAMQCVTRGALPATSDNGQRAKSRSQPGWWWKGWWNRLHEERGSGYSCARHCHVAGLGEEVEGLLFVSRRGTSHDVIGTSLLQSHHLSSKSWGKWIHMTAVVGAGASPTAPFLTSRSAVHLCAADWACSGVWCSTSIASLQSWSFVITASGRTDHSRVYYGQRIA